MAKVDAGRIPDIDDDLGSSAHAASPESGTHGTHDAGAHGDRHAGTASSAARTGKLGRKSASVKRKAHTFSESKKNTTETDSTFDGIDAVVPQTAKMQGKALSDLTPPVANPENPALTQSDKSAARRQKITTSIPNTQTPSQETYESVFSALAPKGPTKKIKRTGTPTILMKNVSMIYPARPNEPALEDVSLEVYPGEFVFLVGHSGSGKSTLLKLLTREIVATDGHVMVAGQELGRMRNWKVPYLRRQIGCVFQDFKLLPDKTTYENVAFTLECIGKPRSVIRTQVPEVLRLVGLAEKTDMYPDQLSGGEQQRVSVARAMVNRPPLLVCDEPTGNLDPAISLGIMKLLERINRTGTTVVMATHDREMVDSMKKRVVALEAGHVIRDQEGGGYGYYGAL